MASSSRCSPQIKHDVFLSFRGEDTRDGFVSHLHAALSNKKIETFIDDKLRRGHEISPSLLKAIEGSTISVIIFSENYASSGWCLDELVKILECKEKYGQVVIPVFYHIDPSDVRKQKGTFADAFIKHEKERVEKVPRWRIALTEAANLSGFDSKVIRPESALLDKIIKNILKKLNDMSQVDNKNLVGINSRVKDILLSLCMELEDVRKVGIWGMGGIGKTTLAYAIFDKVCQHFEAFHFAQDVKEASKMYNDWNKLQKKLLFKITGDRYANVNFTSTIEKLSHKKVLIVFDDVTSINQIEELIGDLNCLGPYSRVIITTRDRQVLKNCGVDVIYEIKGLANNEALQLFSGYAFKQKCPKIDYMDLSKGVVTYAQGLPLALKVLGSFLLGRTKEFWKNALNKLKNIPHGDIQKVLQVSYDDLNYEDKNSFLHISCFLRGWKRKLVEEILDACGFYPGLGMDVLIERSLISISFDETIIMHDLIQEMGREVVRQEFIDDPGKRSQLWHHDDINHVLSQNKGTEAIQAMLMNMFKMEDINLTHAFSKMYNLRFFGAYNSHNRVCNKLHSFERLEFDFRNLRYLYWYEYPFKLLPPNFQAMNLVVLDLPYSNVEQIWRGVQNLVKLKRINLQHCKHLLSIPDFSQAPNLEELILQGCKSLHETPYILHLNKVVTLNLEGCTSLRSSLSEIHSESLKKVIFSGCSSLKLVPQLPSTVEELHLNGTAIEQLPPSIQCASSLKVLKLEYCLQLVSLSSCICHLNSLRFLYLSGCSKLERLPDNLGNLEALEVLEANETAIREVSLPIVRSSNFDELSQRRCKVQEYVGLSHLKTLSLESCSRLENLSNGILQLKSLKFLYLSGCSKLERLSDDFGNLEDLEVLKANGIDVREVPPSIVCPYNFHESSQKRSKVQKHVGSSSLEVLDLENCSSLKSLPNGICSQLKSLKFLYLSGCSKLERLPDDFGDLKALEVLKANGTPIRELPPSIVRLHNLQKLSMQECKNMSIGLQHALPCLWRLKELNLSDCNIVELPNSLGELSSLEYLDLARNNFTSIPTIINLHKLSNLILRNCNMLQSLLVLPHFLNRVQADGCTSLQVVSNSSDLSLIRKGFYYNTNLSFINCLRLDWDALIRNIVDDVLQNFQQNATRSFKTFLGAFLKPSGGISYPGSEIPECFDIQSDGSFIELPQGSINDNFADLIYCTVLAFQDFHYKSCCKIHFDFFVEGEDGTYKSVVKTDGYSGFYDGYIAPIHIKSDHVFVGINCNMNISSIRELAYNRKAIIKFSVQTSYGTMESCKVKKCGVRFIYNQVPGKSMAKHNRCTIRDMKEEEDDGEPHSKRLKLSTAVEGETSPRKMGSL